MKKVICKVEYDTEASELVQKKTFGYYGDPAGYEECLFKTQDGKLFLYCAGGPESPLRRGNHQARFRRQGRGVAEGLTPVPLPVFKQAGGLVSPLLVLPAPRVPHERNRGVCACIEKYAMPCEENRVAGGRDHGIQKSV